MISNPLLLDSITDADETARGQVAICGSHGGGFAGMLASRAGLRGVALNDAGIGYQSAGIAGVKALSGVGMAAVAVDCMSAEIGSAQDMFANGLISYVNGIAASLGVREGQELSDSWHLLEAAQHPHGMLPQMDEQRWNEVFDPQKAPLLCVDSASLIKPEDAGRIIVTGSHGGLIGGNPARACKADAHLVCFSDAGRGKNDIGLSRLPALDQRGVAALTVSCDSCAIGDARSALTTGVISALNDTAKSFGLSLGEPLSSGLQKLT